MLLIHLLKILFWLLIIRHTIKWVSYHWHHRHKKTRIFHGNTRMPFDVELALMYGINALKKTRFKVKDLSYRKTLVQWKLLLNEIYPDDGSYFIRRLNSNLVTPKSPEGDFGVGHFSTKDWKQFPFHIHSDLKSPAYIPMESERDSGVTTWNNNFTKIKKIYNVFTAKPFAKNNRVDSSLLLNTKIASLNNLKNSQNPIPFPKQIFACTYQIFTVCFPFILFLRLNASKTHF